MPGKNGMTGLRFSRSSASRSSSDIVSTSTGSPSADCSPPLALMKRRNASACSCRVSAKPWRCNQVHTGPCSGSAAIAGWEGAGEAGAGSAAGSAGAGWPATAGARVWVWRFGPQRRPPRLQAFGDRPRTALGPPPAGLHHLPGAPGLPRQTWRDPSPQTRPLRGGRAQFGRCGWFPGQIPPEAGQSGTRARRNCCSATHVPWHRSARNRHLASACQTMAA